MRGYCLTTVCRVTLDVTRLVTATVARASEIDFSQILILKKIHLRVPQPI
jgi:hypothetical protein